MRFLNLSLLKLTVCLVVGIYIGFYANIKADLCIIILGTSIILFALWYSTTRNRISNTKGIDVFIFLIMIWIGITNVQIHNPMQHQDHYSHQLSSQDEVYEMTIRIRERLKPSLYYYKYVGELINVQGKSVKGKILVQIAKASGDLNLKVDQRIYTRASLKKIEGPRNPNQFDYRKYLSKKYIYHQLNLNTNEIAVLAQAKTSILGLADQWRTFLQNRLSQDNWSNDEQAIINALLLGQRQDISRQLNQSYANAGAIHILAISGLHVGIILFLLSWLLKPLEFFYKGKFIKTVLIILLLWTYAIIAGLSASVVRAVTMFSIFAIAMNLNRRTNVYNTLAFSAFILLLFRPLFLFDVGFQLSYAAVLGIVAFQPLLAKIWQPSFFLFHYFWSIFTVSIAAQLGILPLSLCYFHQFPGLFMVTNMVIIPFLGIILGLGLIILFLAAIGAQANVLVMAFAKIISVLNAFVQWIGNQEQFLFKKIPFDASDVVLSYALLIAIYWIALRRSFKAIRTVLLVIVIYQCFALFRLHDEKKEFIIFHKSKKTIIGKRVGRHFTLWHNLDSLEFRQEQILENYLIQNRISKISTSAVPDVLRWMNDTILLVDSLAVYNVKSFKPHVVLLRNSPKLNLNRLIDSLDIRLVISDGSNYRSYQERWKETCQTKKIPFHNTSEKGAYIFNE